MVDKWHFQAKPWPDLKLEYAAIQMDLLKQQKDNLLIKQSMKYLLYEYEIKI
jgi:hypothetical protein